MTALENTYIPLQVAADGSVTWCDAANFYQYSNETTGVVLYTPYSGAGVSALINVRLPDGTVLPEAPMSVAGIEEVNGVTYYLWSYDFASIATSLSGCDYAAPIMVSFRFTESSGKTKNTNQVRIPIQPSLQGEGMVIDCDTADMLNGKIDKVAGDLAETDQRVKALEDTMVRKVLVDFTVNDQTGEGVKYYSDGTTANVQFPTGGGAPPVVTDWLRVIEFTADSFVGGELAFGPQQTGFTNNKYTAILDRKGTAEYEAGVETAPSVKQGYWQTANSFFKGSDGSILLTGVNKPFDGRLVLLSGVAFSGRFVTGARYDAAANSVVLAFVNGETESVPLADAIKTIAYSLDTNAITATTILGAQTVLQLPNAVSGATYDAAANSMVFATLDGSALTVPLGNALSGVSFDSNTYRMTFTRQTGEPIVIDIPKPEAAQRYYGVFGAESWQGAAAPYTITIPETAHAKGLHPVYRFYDNQYFGVSVAANGDMTVSSNVKKAFTIIIL